MKADVTIAVGHGGNLTFAPENVTVHPDQTVGWEWKSDTHNVAVEDHPDDANWKGTPAPVSKVYDRGYRYTHTFETVGEYEYFCQPHQAAGMVGTVTVSPAVTSGTATETTTDGTPPATKDDLPIEVGPGGSLEFAPDLLEVSAGTEVTFVWMSNTHNVAVESQPKRANRPSSPGGDGATYDAGYEYRYTFEVPGEYEYYCVPHETMGMKGTIIVE